MQPAGLGMFIDFPLSYTLPPQFISKIFNVRWQHNLVVFFLILLLLLLLLLFLI